MREFSAGGVVVDVVDGQRVVAVILPQGRPDGHWTLPKGRIDAAERGIEAALREVREETGLTCETVARLTPQRYIYTRDGERVFKVVTFWLMRPVAGRLGEIEPAMRVEVADTRWLPLAEAERLLAYPGERKAASEALGLLDA